MDQLNIGVTKLCPMVCVYNIYIYKCVYSSVTYMCIILSHLHGWPYPRAQLSQLATSSCDFWQPGNLCHLACVSMATGMLTLWSWMCSRCWIPQPNRWSGNLFTSCWRMKSKSTARARSRAFLDTKHQVGAHICHILWVCMAFGICTGISEKEFVCEFGKSITWMK